MTYHSKLRTPAETIPSPEHSVSASSFSRKFHFTDASTQAHFEAMSLIHALGWRDTYPGFVPEEYMRKVITDDHWVDIFRADYETGRAHGLLLYQEQQNQGKIPVGCINYGPARLRPDVDTPYEGWGEILSFYVHPDYRGNGFGGLLMDEALTRLKKAGHTHAFVLVLRENQKARRFYSAHGFTWDGTQKDIPFPPDAVCVDFRYVQTL